MATDGPTPDPCDHEVFERGTPIVLLDGTSNAVERWVRAVADAADARLDWHYSGGVAQVLHLAENGTRERVETAINELEGSLDGRIMQRLAVGAKGLYRRCEPYAREDAIGYYDDGRTAYM